MTQKEKITAADIAALRVQAGQSEKRIKNAARMFERTPEKGVFVKPVLKEFELEQPDGTTQKVQSLGYLIDNGGFISETALLKSNVEDKLVSIKTGARRGKYMLRMSRLTDLTKFGKSINEQLAALEGKKFQAIPREIRVYKQQYLANSAAFDNVVIDEKEIDNDEQKAINELLRFTEISNGYEFIITD